MKIAIGIFKNIVAPRFDFSEQLYIYEIQNNKIINKKILNIVLEYSFEIISLLKSENISTVICGGGPRMLLRNLLVNGIDVKIGNFIEPDLTVKMYLEGKLDSSFVPPFGFKRGRQGRNIGQYNSGKGFVSGGFGRKGKVYGKGRKK